MNVASTILVNFCRCHGEDGGSDASSNVEASFHTASNGSLLARWIISSDFADAASRLGLICPSQDLSLLADGLPRTVLAKSRQSWSIKSPTMSLTRPGRLRTW